MRSETLQCIAYKVNEKFTARDKYIAECVQTRRSAESFEGILDAQKKLHDNLEKYAYTPGGLDDLRDNFLNPVRPLAERVTLNLKVFTIGLKGIFRPVEFAYWNYNLPSTLQVEKKHASAQP